MEFQFTKEQEAFRQEIQSVLKENPPESFPTQSEDEAYGYGCWSYEFARFMGENGWLALTLPKEYGSQEEEEQGGKQTYRALSGSRLARRGGPLFNVSSVVI